MEGFFSNFVCSNFVHVLILCVCSDFVHVLVSCVWFADRFDFVFE